MAADVLALYVAMSSGTMAMTIGDKWVTVSIKKHYIRHIRSKIDIEKCLFFVS